MNRVIYSDCNFQACTTRVGWGKGWRSGRLSGVGAELWVATWGVCVCACVCVCVCMACTGLRQEGVHGYEQKPLQLETAGVRSGELRKWAEDEDGAGHGSQWRF